MTGVYVAALFVELLLVLGATVYPLVLQPIPVLAFDVLVLVLFGVALAGARRAGTHLRPGAGGGIERRGPLGSVWMSWAEIAAMEMELVPSGFRAPSRRMMVVYRVEGGSVVRTPLYYCREQVVPSFEVEFDLIREEWLRWRGEDRIDGPEPSQAKEFDQGMAALAATGDAGIWFLVAAVLGVFAQTTIQRLGSPPLWSVLMLALATALIRWPGSYERALRRQREDTRSR